MAEILGDITMVRGDSYPLNLTVKSKATKLPIDLTGYVFMLTVTSDKDPINNTTKIFHVSGVVDSDQIANPGKVSFTPTALNTAAVITGWYDIEMRIGAVIRSITKTEEGIDLRFTITQDRTK